MSKVQTCPGHALLCLSISDFPGSVFAGKYLKTEKQRQAHLPKLSDTAIEWTHHLVGYDPAYVHSPNTGGDVPADTRIDPDEIIRS